LMDEIQTFFHLQVIINRIQTTIKQFETLLIAGMAKIRIKIQRINVFQKKSGIFQL
jgi:hypothetical protein